jgi:hypothetical protein
MCRSSRPGIHSIENTTERRDHRRVLDKLHVRAVADGTQMLG